ncbi:MAG: SAM-dependent chlorinase/fluorinase [Nitrospinae bacterium]|nr:SAM-dependent chlorinase/fluorinase [Nitrospinota bacterium]
MPRPIVALLTDFGYRDPWVGMMKGVMLGINPTLQLIDITHEITPQRVCEAAIVLSVAYPYFPSGTIYLVVVDPGVGGARRALVAETANHIFIAPDNGVVGPVLEGTGVRRVIQLTNDAYFRPQISRTFHGRDVFAPVAAWLSRGVDVGAMGQAIDDYARLELPQPRALANGTLEGELMYQDRFGNFITSLSEAWVAQQWGPAPWAAVAAQIENYVIHGLDSYYAQRPPAELGMIFNSWGFLEIFVNQGHAGQLTGVSEGTPIRVWQDHAGKNFCRTSLDG